PSTTSVKAVGEPSKPRSSPRRAGLNENDAMARTRPEPVVPANSRIQEPSVKDSATIAAVALESVTAAATKATPAMTKAYSAWPDSTVSSSGQYRWPPRSKPQIASADT